MNRIIQCPACNTKFALNESQLNGLDNPKFHCSRCNTLFTLKNNENPVQEEIKADPVLESILDSQNIESLDNDNSNEQINIDKESTLDDEIIFDSTIEDNDLNETVEDNWYLGHETSIDLNPEVPDTIKYSNILSKSTYESTNFDLKKNVEEEKDEIEDSQLPLFSKKISDEENKIEPGMLLIDHKNDLEDTEGIKVSWESSNPDVPHEVDFSKHKNSPVSSDVFNTKETKVISRSDIKEEIEKMDSPLSILSKSDSPEGEITPKSLNELFKRESRKNKDPVHVTGTHSKIDHDEDTEQDESEQDDDELPSKITGEIALSSITPSLTQEISPTPNRSMKHTTVVKRDELELSGFEEEDDEDEEIHNVPQILRKNKQSKFLSFTEISLPTAFFLTLVSMMRIGLF
jgi:predicted Zn finger-like uncharacterized protein